jgi:hypothetical protein
VAVLAAALAMTGCAGAGAKSPSSAGSPSSTTSDTTPQSPGSPKPATAAAGAASARGATGQAGGTGTQANAGAKKTDLRDGRYAARIVKVAIGTRTIRVDLVQIFVGKAAAKAAAEDHAPEVPPPNDMWIRNASHLLRTLPVTTGAPITVNTLGAAESGSAVKDIPRTFAQLSSTPSVASAVFWLTLKHGQVTRIAEQYLP